MLASLVLMSSYKTVLKEHTRQCLLDLMLDAVRQLKATLYCTQTLNCLDGHYLCRGGGGGGKKIGGPRLF